MKNNICILNGELVPLEKATVSVSDLALQRGYGVFDFFKVVNGVPVFMDLHLERFFRSAKALRLDPPLPQAVMRDLIFEMLQTNKIADSGVKITLTGGNSVDGFTPAKPNLIIVQSALSVSQNFRETGIKIITSNYMRQMPAIKTTDYLMAVWLQPLIKSKDAQDVLYHFNNQITECPRANIFIVNRQQQILTPASNVLHGIIRGRVLQMDLDLEIREADLTLQDLQDAAEIFITSTTKNVLPVTCVDDRLVGSGKPGKISQIVATELDSIITDSLMVNKRVDNS